MTVEKSKSPMYSTNAPEYVGHNARNELSMTLTDTLVLSLGTTDSKT